MTTRATSRSGQMRQAGIGEQHALSDLGGERDHPLAQRGEHDRRQRADPFIGFELINKGAGIGQRLAGRDAESLMHRAVRYPDAETKAPARNLVNVSGAHREFFRRLGIDRGYRSAERDPFRSQCQPRALRYIAVPARHIDAGKAAPLDLAGDVEGLAAPSWYSDEADGR